MKRKIFIILFLLIVVSIYQITNQTIFIPDTSIRLRVIPNSNDPKDINIKEQVKEYLEKDIYTLTKDTTDIEDARNIINNNLKNIDNNIESLFKKNNYNLPYEVNFGSNYFPQKEYKGITYEEGFYESLVISIGEAKGDNWWCVLFPNFCLVDTSNNQDYKSYFQELINKIF